MRAITIIVLIWIIAVLASSGWQHFVKAAASFQVGRQADQQNEALRKAVAQ